MKYWRGYVVAAIIAAITAALTSFAAGYRELVDMIYPYVTRLVVSYLADWSAGVGVCLWQVITLLLIAGVLASVTLMIILRWNPVQWLGWVLAVACGLYFFHTAIYGLNYYAGSIADDVQLTVADYTVSELNEATRYFQTKANELAQQVSRDEAGNLQYAEFEDLAQQAGEGFRVLTYERSKSVFAGSTAPVKKLGWSGMYTSMGISGITIAMTGEAAVNPNIPVVALPFTMCHEMAHRMSIVSEDDANFAAFLACDANPSVEFQYSAYFMAYRYCYKALAANTTSTAQACIAELQGSVDPLVTKDMQDYSAFYAKYKDKGASNIANSANDFYLKTSGEEDGVASYAAVTDLLVSWHIQEFVLPMHKDDETVFDPMDESQVDLSGLVNAQG